MAINGITHHKSKISSLDFRGLVSGTIQYVPYENATLRAEGFGEDRRFVMRGPSGMHTLLVVATDLARLNAHWSVFATDPRNAIAAAPSARSAQRREVAQMQAQR